MLRDIWNRNCRGFLTILLLNIAVSLAGGILIVMLVPIPGLLDVSTGTVSALTLLMLPLQGLSPTARRLKAGFAKAYGCNATDTERHNMVQNEGKWDVPPEVQEKVVHANCANAVDEAVIGEKAVKHRVNDDVGDEMRKVGDGLQRFFVFVAAHFVEHQRQNDRRGKAEDDAHYGQQHRVAEHAGELAAGEKTNEMMEPVLARPGAAPDAAGEFVILKRDYNAHQRFVMEKQIIDEHGEEKRIENPVAPEYAHEGMFFHVRTLP